MKKWWVAVICFGLITVLVACGSKISKEEAYAIALEDAGVTEGDITLTEETMDDNEFKFVFHTDTESYEYEIDEDGTIEKRSVTKYQAQSTEQDKTTDDANTSETNTGGTDTPAEQTTTPLTQEQALEQAYTHFQVSETEVTNLKVKKEVDDGQEVYDIEFDVGTKEYSCEINVQTGEMRSYDVDER